MRIPSIVKAILPKKESKLEKEIKRTWRQKTIELYGKADTHLNDCVREWRKGAASRKDWFLKDVKDLISLDVKLPKTEYAQGNIDRVMLAAAYAMEMEKDDLREQIYYVREVIRKLIKLNGSQFFNQTPNEIAAYFANQQFQTISPEQARGFLLPLEH